MQKPVILLAFANDREDSSSFLSELQPEQTALDDLLSSHLNVVQKPVATHPRIEQSFNIHGKRIRIFHFAGHANAHQIELAMGSDGHKGGYVAGVAKYIGLQKGVELVFLNGCSTQGQVQHFLKASIPAVIATTSAVNDKIAREFAVLFYSTFVLNKHKKSLKQAFEEAKAQLQGRYPKQEHLYTRGFVREGKVADFPYQLHLNSLRAGELCFEDLFLEETDTESTSIPPNAHLLCNREEANEDFKEVVKDHLRRPLRQPLLCLVHAEEQELPLALCKRFYEFTLGRTFKSLDLILEKSRFERYEVEMPRARDFRKKDKAMDRVKESFKEILEMEEVANTQIRSIDGQQVIQQLGTHLRLVLFQHNLYAEDWHHDLSADFFQEYLGQFWQGHLPEKSPEILLLFSLQYAPKKGFLSRFKKRDHRLLTSFASQETQRLEELLPVARIDLRRWNDRYATDDPGLTDRLYGSKKALPMEVLLPELRAVVDRRRS